MILGGYNAAQMFTDCNRLNEIKVNSQYVGGTQGLPVKGWSINFGLAGLEDTRPAGGGMGAINY